MVKYFPVPYEDEILYSLIARYIKHTGSYSSEQVAGMLFGRRFANYNLLIQLRITAFHNRVKEVFNRSPYQLVNNFTLWPYLKRGIKEEYHKEVYNEILTPTSASSINRIGIRKHPKLSNNIPLYCPLCAINDFQEYGETYWRRSHQIPGITVCTTHNCFLKKVEYSYSKPYTYLVPDLSIIDTEEINFNRNNKTYELAGFLKNLLDTKDKVNFRTYDYHTAFAKLGYQEQNRINNKRLYNDLCDFYSLGFIKDYIGNCETRIKDLVALLTIKKGKVANPLFHVIIQYFIAHSSKNKITKSEIKCPNPICKNQNNKDSKSIRVYDSTESRYVFETICGCGMQTRRYSTFNPENKITTDHIKIVEYGIRWKNQLKEYIELGHTSSYISQKLKCNINLIMAEMAKLNFTIGLNGKIEKQPTFADSRLKKYKKTIENYLSNPNNKVTKVRLDHPRAYNYILIHDRKWLKEKKNENQESNRLARKRKDKELMKRLKDILRILKDANYPYCISTSIVCSKDISEGQKAYQNGFSNYPITKAFLDKNCESIKDLYLRLIRYAYKELKEEVENVTKNSIVMHPLLATRKHRSQIQNLTKDFLLQL